MAGQDEANNAQANGERLERQPLIPPPQPTYVNFRLGREQQDVDKCKGFVLNIFKVSFCSLGLWSHQAWNFIPRVLVIAICVYQAVYDFYVVLGCHGFDCSFLQNSTDSKKPSHHKEDRQIANAVYTVVSLAAVVSYVLFIVCFVVARRKDSAFNSSTLRITEGRPRDAECLVLVFCIFYHNSALFNISGYVLRHHMEQSATKFVL